jgi:hypothetical protein
MAIAMESVSARAGSGDARMMPTKLQLERAVAIAIMIATMMAMRARGASRAACCPRQSVQVCDRDGAQDGQIGRKHRKWRRRIAIGMCAQSLRQEDGVEVL